MTNSISNGWMPNLERRKPAIKNKVREQILKVRDTGAVNMFDINGVQVVAYKHDLYDLVVYLDDKKNRAEYSNFIITGEAPLEDEEAD